MARTVIDPVTRIEGHMRVEVEVSGGEVKDAWVSGTLYRGMETVLRHMCEGLLERGHEVVALVAGVEPSDRDEIVALRGVPGGLRVQRAGALAVVNSQPLVPSLPALLHRRLAAF